MKTVSRRSRFVKFGSLFAIMMIFPNSSSAGEFWASHRTRVGYEQFFTSIQFSMVEQEPVRISFDTGFIHSFSRIFSVEPRYTLKLPTVADELGHEFRLAARFKFE